MNNHVLLLLSKKLVSLLPLMILVSQFLLSFSFQEEVVYTVNKEWRKNILITHWPYNKFEDLMNLIWEEDWETDVFHWAPETEVHSKMYCVIWTCTQPKLLTFNGLSQCLTNYNSSAKCIPYSVYLNNTLPVFAWPYLLTMLLLTMYLRGDSSVLYKMVCVSLLHVHWIVDYNEDTAHNLDWQQVEEGVGEDHQSSELLSHPLLPWG